MSLLDNLGKVAEHMLKELEDDGGHSDAQFRSRSKKSIMDVTEEVLQVT